jgi:hypothetical protein
VLRFSSLGRKREAVVRRSAFLIAALISGCPPPPSPPDGGTPEDAGVSDAGQDDGGLDAGRGTLLTVCGVPAPASAPPYAFIDVGNGAGIACLRKSDRAVVGVDGTGRWVLWRNTDGVHVADGQTSCNELLALRGDNFTYLDPAQQFRVRSAVDGALLSSHPLLGRLGGLAVDGSYVWISSSSSLEVFTPSGTRLFSHAGDYSSAKVFADTAELHVARGTTLEHFAVPSGTAGASSTFSGTFTSWFLDGSHFFTSLGDTVWIYDADGTQRAVLSIPQVFPSMRLRGRGEWFWVFIQTGRPVPFYRLDAGSTPVETRTVPYGTFADDDEYIAVISYGAPGFEVLHLEPSGIRSTTFTAPLPFMSTFA